LNASSSPNFTIYHFSAHIIPSFQTLSPLKQLSSTSITFYTQHFRSINESLSLCPQFEQQFFFGTTANNAVMNQIGTTTTTTNWNWNTSNNKKHWQNRLDWNIKETATMTRSWHDRVNSFTTRLSHRRYTHRSHTDHRRSLSLSQPNLRRHHLYRRRHWWKRKERWEIEIPETYLLF